MIIMYLNYIYAVSVCVFIYVDILSVGTRIRNFIAVLNVRGLSCGRTVVICYPLGREGPFGRVMRKRLGSFLRQNFP